ncbi:MAG: glutathione peroxidase [Holosporales bacterium]
MLKTSLFSRFFRWIAVCSAALIPAASVAAPPAGSAYDFSFTALRGGAPLPLEAYRGKVLLIVNTASKCGFTGQYEGLEKLYNDYKDKGLVVIGVPSNDFGKQEPGSGEDIAKFCELNYGVTFPMAAKESVSGEAAHPFYKWARGVVGMTGAPKWNFHKYLINRKGELTDYFHSTTAPDAELLRKAVETALAE